MILHRKFSLFFLYSIVFVFFRCYICLIFVYILIFLFLGFDRIDLWLDTPCECVLFLCVFGSAEEESEDGEGAIDKEDFETEFVAPKEFDWEAVDEHGGNDWKGCDERHEAVANVPFGEHTNDEESE